MKDLLVIGSAANTAIAANLDPNSVNLLINAVLTVVVFMLRFWKKKGGNNEIQEK